jgi:hypothetical protein
MAFWHVSSSAVEEVRLLQPFSPKFQLKRPV